MSLRHTTADENGPHMLSLRGTLSALGIVYAPSNHDMTESVF